MSFKSISKTIGLIILIGMVNTTVAFAADATLTFNPANSTQTVGQNFDVAILLNTDGIQTDGTRATIDYNSNLLEVVSISEGVYNSYPTQSITEERITISGISSVNGPYYSGSGTFATITFQPKTAGTTQLSFAYTDGSTTDSNVAEHDTNRDILSSVGTASLTLQNADSGSADPTITPTLVPTATPTTTTGGSPDNSDNAGAPVTSTNELPQSGVAVWTWLAALLAISSFSSGSLLLRRI